MFNSAPMRLKGCEHRLQPFPSIVVPENCPNSRTRHTTLPICDGVDYPHLAWQFSIGDFDADADTDFADFCILAEHWLAADGSFWCGQGCDLTNDGSVNWQDLMVFAENWLR